MCASKKKKKASYVLGTGSTYFTQYSPKNSESKE